MSVVFYASSLGQGTLRVLARFVADAHGLHAERFDRTEGRWIRDPRIAGYVTGHDDWAEPIDRTTAQSLIGAWGHDPQLISAPVSEVAAT